MRYLLGIIVLLIVLAIAGYYIAPELQEPLDSAARAELSKSGEAQSFVKLDSGTVHYRSAVPFGPSGGTIVLVHGFSSNSFIWRDYMYSLASRGYRVLALDLYGRGYSDRPDEKYDSKLFQSQLKEFVDEMSPGRPVHLIGYSMGGAIAADFAAKNSHRVETLGLIAPAGLECGQVIWSVTTLPVIGDVLFRVAGGPLAASNAAKTWADAQDPDYYNEAFKKQLRYRGYGDALLSTLRNYPLRDRCEAMAEVGKRGERTLIIWGEDDTVTPVSGADKAAELIPAARIVRVPDAGHGVPFTNTDLVLSEIGLLISLEP